MTQLKTAQTAAAAMAPKIQGTLVLDRALAGLDLDFMILMSSVAAFTGGGPGQIDYCAANAFLDAFAHHRRGAHGAGHLQGRAGQAGQALDGWGELVLRDAGVVVEGVMALAAAAASLSSRTTRNAAAVAFATTAAKSRVSSAAVATMSRCSSTAWLT